MPRSLRLTSIAFATCLAAASFGGGASAQTTIGAVGTFQRQTLPPAAPAPTQPGPRTGVHNNAVTGAVQDILRQPRFIVEAMHYDAIDESGPDSPGSDEVYAIYSNPQNGAITSVVEDVDTEDRIEFDAAQRCVWPIVDPDNSVNGEWACDARGGAGPVRARVSLYDLDLDYWDPLFPNWCINTSSTDIRASNPGCSTDHSDKLFDYEFAYETAEILAHLDPSCRCWTQTARYRENDWRGDLEYQVTIRITRVDQGGESAGVDAGPVVLSSGTLMTVRGRSFELDSGATPAAGGDLDFTRVGDDHFLTPAGGAKIWIGSMTPRGYRACNNQRTSANYVTAQVSVPPVGAHACYLTNQGHVGEFRVDELIVRPNGSSFLTLTYTTWE